MMAKKGNLTVVGGTRTSIGHNSGATEQEMSDDNTHALTRQKAKKRTLLVDAEKKAKAARMQFDKEIKAELGEHGLDNIKLLDSLSTPEGEKKFREEMDRQATVARWAGLNIGDQGSLFDSVVPPLTERAFDEGKRAGMDDEQCSPPYSDKEVADSWTEGWHAGREAFANHKSEQDEGATVLLRPAENKPLEADEFDESAEQAQPTPASSEGAEQHDQSGSPVSHGDVEESTEEF